jgi:hypothetical protein
MEPKKTTIHVLFFFFTWEIQTIENNEFFWLVVSSFIASFYNKVHHMFVTHYCIKASTYNINQWPFLSNNTLVRIGCGLDLKKRPLDVAKQEIATLMIGYGFGL